MRMWMIPCRLLCRQHLLGEHGEIHKHKHNFIKMHSMAGRKGQILPERMQDRHDALADEMVRRGFNHNSPYVQPLLHDMYKGWSVDVDYNIQDLMGRCASCRENIMRYIT